MSRRQKLFMCALPALSTVVLASEGKSAAAVADTTATDTTTERGVPALFSWGDINGDGRLDLAAVSGNGSLQLLANTGDGRFEDVTARSGLSTITNAALALWADYDGDGRLDLFVGAREGASRLFHNEVGVFIDMTAGSGFSIQGSVQSAQWFDYDADGRVDLFVITKEKSELFKGLAGGYFELVKMPLADIGIAPTPNSGPIDSNGVPMDTNGVAPPRDPGSSSDGDDTPGHDSRRGVGSQGRVSGSGLNLTSIPSIATPFPAPLFACATAMRDQANPNTCMNASTTPALGVLYPISANLFVAVGGNVGIGTTTPSAKLEVSGTARITNTLTLNPGVDQALDVSSGSIYKGGMLFIHTKGGTANTAIGELALSSNTTGFDNTASGYRALDANTSGAFNTASGMNALVSNTTGAFNTASGARALSSNNIGFRNTASGYMALGSNTAGSYNTANGMRALGSNTFGFYNTASGYRALGTNSDGDNNVANGDRALFSNTNGHSNTASGRQALYSNTTGDRNTASGDRALRFNTTGNRNTASGNEALYFNTGYGNTATGDRALRSNTTGHSNTASGRFALFSNTTSDYNTASGAWALYDNATGYRNTASGARALFSNTTGGYNTASGHRSLNANTTGSRNIAVGRDAGMNLTTGNDNIAIGNSGVVAEGATIRIGTAGTHTRAFVSGIRGVTTVNANAIPVLVDSVGQLGTVSSSQRFKKDIADMGNATERLLELRPVCFRYKQEQTMPDGSEVPLEYGLIAEEVAEIFPDLVVYDDEGKPFTVKYHILSSMLLNEMKKIHQASEADASELKQLREGMQKQGQELAEHRSELTRLRSLETRLAAMESRTSDSTLPAAVPSDRRWLERREK